LTQPEQPELPPEDPDELARWLEKRRERAKQAHDVQMAWLNELDREAEEAVKSICTGC
jgi:poly(3-hydroxyalkanoate) synthetase